MMKFLVVALLLALTASASAGVYKIIEESKDRVNNGDNKDAVADVNGNNKENKGPITNGYNADASASTGVNKILGESEGSITNSYKADVLPSDGVYEFHNESEDNHFSGYNNDVMNKENEDSISNRYNFNLSASNEVNETHKESKGRITNGYNAYHGQFPHQVFLYFPQYQRYTWCGGSLIGSRWVLTAAHCTSGKQTVTVYLGSIQRYYGTAYTVSKNNIIIHHAYNPYYLKNDISLIQIPDVSLNNPYVQPIKLPAISNQYSSYVGENVIASGWGQTSDSNSAGSNYLQWSRFQVVNDNVCTYNLGYQFTSTNICIATSRGISPCFGDSGGALILENSKVQIGVFSFLRRPCESGYPTAFTRVTSYLDWIRYYTGIYYI